MFSLPLFPQVDDSLPIADQIEQLQAQLQELQKEQLLQGENASEELLQMIEACFVQFNHLVDQLELGLSQVPKEPERKIIKEEPKKLETKKPKNVKVVKEKPSSVETGLPNLYLIETRLKEMFHL